MQKQLPKTQSSKKIRNCEVALHRWGSNDPDAASLILLHGFLDCGSSWQLMVDELLPRLNGATQQKWAIIAPDWRGFGDSSWNEQHYWFPDYLADLDALLDSLSTGKSRPVIAGHSMGANIAGLYAGARPEKLAALALLEGFGLPDSEATTAPERMTQWLDEIQQPPKHRIYNDKAALVASMQKYNKRLNDDVADFIAGCWCKPVDESKPDGPVQLKADPRHRMRGPVLYRRAEALSFWQNITAPTLWVEGAETNFTQFYEEHDLKERQAAISGLQHASIANAGHMLHHEQPMLVANTLLEFITQPAVQQRMANDAKN